MKSLNRSLPTPVVLSVLVVAIAGAVFAESKSLEKLEPQVPKDLSCVKCHTDRRTLMKIAEKANDPMYLVKTGDLTVEQLRRYMRPDNKSVPKRAPGSKTGHPVW